MMTVAMGRSAASETSVPLMSAVRERIEHISGNKSLNPIVKADALALLPKVQGRLANVDADTLAAVLLFVELRRRGVPVLEKDFISHASPTASDMTRIRREMESGKNEGRIDHAVMRAASKSFRRTYKMVKKVLGISQMNQPQDFVARFCGRLNVSKDMPSIILDFLGDVEKATTRRPVIGSKPVIIAGAATYITCIFACESRTQGKVADIAGATPTSIRLACYELFELYAKVHPEIWNDSLYECFKRPLSSQ